VLFDVTLIELLPVETIEPPVAMVLQGVGPFWNEGEAYGEITIELLVM